MNGLDWGTILTLSYPWIKAAHVIFVIFWIAGLFMLPRYYVYHQETVPGSSEDKAWSEREAKLRRIILEPSMILVWILGVTLAFITGAWGEGWFHAKLVLVLGLSAYHGWLIGYGRRLAGGKRSLTGKSLRIMNEVPGIAAAGIVILVIVKPF